MANIARAKAKRAAKDAQARLQLDLGKAAIEAGLTSADLKVLGTMTQVLEAWFGPEGAITFDKGSTAHLAALRAMKGIRQLDLQPLEDWWKAKGWPVALSAQTASNAPAGSENTAADAAPPAKP